MVMTKFVLSDRYRLDLCWESAKYETEGMCKLDNAYFFGPALADAQKVNENDHIMLNFFRQYIIVVENVYVAKFSWKEVTYNSNGKIFLGDAMITHDTELNRVPKLKSDDYLIIDTSDHEDDTHKFILLYKTYVVNEDTQLYDFGDN